MSDAELIARLRDADRYNAEHYERDPLHKQAADRIEALIGERDWYMEEWVSAVDRLNKAVEALEVIRGRQYYRMGPGVTAQVIARATLAEIKGEGHEALP